MLKIFLVALTIVCAFGANGIDIGTDEGPYTLDTWKCIKSAGYDLAIIEIWRGDFQLSDHFTTDWLNARKAGLKVDSYIFACSNCTGNDPNNVCTNVVQALPSGFDGKVWLDIEDCSSRSDCFPGTPADRLAFFESVASACTAKGLAMGVYSYHNGWAQLFGATNYTSGNLTSLPLWYAHYNNDTTYSDFPQYGFGDWKQPAMKQWNAGINVCGVVSDLDVYFPTERMPSEDLFLSY